VLIASTTSTDQVGGSLQRFHGCACRRQPGDHGDECLVTRTGEPPSSLPGCGPPGHHPPAHQLAAAYKWR
jgi:hypothetical protein